MTTRTRMVGVAVAAALVAVAVPVFASGAGPASAANTATAASRTAVVVCPTGTTSHRSASRVERGGRKHGRQIPGCKCLTSTGATGQTGALSTSACNPCPALGSVSTGSTTASRFYAGHPILRRLHRIARRVLCSPCPPAGATGSTGSTTSMPTIVLCNPCPRRGATGASGSTGSTGSTWVPAARVLPFLLCHRPPCLSGAAGIANSRVRVAFACQPCPGPGTGPMTSMTRLFGRRGGVSSVVCNPCPATGSTGTSGAHPTILGHRAQLGCICSFVHGQSSRGATGATGATTSCAPPPCPQPLAVAGRGAMWRCGCVQTGATGTTASQCSPPVCERWGATGATGATTRGGYACPAPPKPCMSTSTAGGGQTATWCGGSPIPCNPPPEPAGQQSQGAYACPMVAPQSGASVSA